MKFTLKHKRAQKVSNPGMFGKALKDTFAATHYKKKLPYFTEKEYADDYCISSNKMMESTLFPEINEHNASTR